MSFKRIFLINIKNSSQAKKFTKSRGPDADGEYKDDFFTILHDRLSILDLSSSANQPMVFENLVITYNGEIYNFKELRKELINYGYKFKTIQVHQNKRLGASSYGTNLYSELKIIWAIIKSIPFLIKKINF